MENASGQAITMDSNGPLLILLAAYSNATCTTAAPGILGNQNGSLEQIATLPTPFSGLYYSTEEVPFYLGASLVGYSNVPVACQSSSITVFTAQTSQLAVRGPAAGPPGACIGPYTLVGLDTTGAVLSPNNEPSMITIAPYPANYEGGLFTDSACSSTPVNSPFSLSPGSLTFYVLLNSTPPGPRVTAPLTFSANGLFSPSLQILVQPAAAP